MATWVIEAFLLGAIVGLTHTVIAAGRKSAKRL